MPPGTNDWTPLGFVSMDDIIIFLCYDLVPVLHQAITCAKIMNRNFAII